MSQKNDFLTYFAEMIERESGIVYAEHNFFQLASRLETIAKMNNCVSVNELYQLTMRSQNRMLIESIVDVSTNNETLFFRDEKMFNSIREFLSVSDKKSAITDSQINVWSAACSTGQEPISLSIVLFETVGSGFSILATDISGRVLEVAKRGVYSDLQVSRGLSDGVREKYFKRIAPNQWQVTKEIHSSIKFEQLNLRSNTYPHSKFHIILCRNVLLYQKESAKIEIIEKISDRLYPGGFLVLGSGESTLGLSQRFNQVEIGGSIFYRLVDLESRRAG